VENYIKILVFKGLAEYNGKCEMRLGKMAKMEDFSGNVG
jgi:hypothetical protein